jgi:hypothetical protein
MHGDNLKNVKNETCGTFLKGEKRKGISKMK